VYPLIRPAVLLDEQLTKSNSKAEQGEGVTQPSGQKLISFNEVEKHNTEEDAWVIINVSSDVIAVVFLQYKP
jgi:cytochrome b involved in lipid metabolism